MSPAELVECRIDGSLATLELNRPATGNAIDLPLASALGRQVHRVSQDPAVRCLLITGAGKVFCAGGDVSAMASAEDQGAFLAELAGVAHEAVRALADLEIPVVAAVQGAAAGAGLALALVSDVVVAAETAKFVPAYSAVGLTPDCGTTWLLPQMIGLRRALQISLTNQVVSAADAVSWGIATETAREEDLQAVALAVATTLSRGPNPALGLTRRLLRGDLEGLAQRLDLEAATIAQVAQSSDARARVAAVAERQRR